MKEVAAAIGIGLIALIVSGVALYMLYAQSLEIRKLIHMQSAALSNLSSNVSKIREGVKNVSGGLKKFSSRVAAIDEKVQDLEAVLKNFRSELRTVKGNVSDLAGSINESIASLKSMIQESRYPFSITDALGRSVTINHKPLRIVSTAPSVTEMLFLIGGGKQVVGVDQFSNYPPIVQQLRKNGTLKVVGGFSTLNIEAILKLKPDLVVMTSGVQLKYAKELSDMGVTVYVVKTETVSDIFEDVLTLGLITGHQDNAAKVVQDMSNIILNTRGKVLNYLNQTGGKEAKVYYEIYPDCWTIGSGSFINDLIQLAGGVNIFSNVTRPYFIASPESVVKANPGVILVNYNYGQFGPPNKLLQRLEKRPGWGNITAFENDRAYVISGLLEDIIDRPGPRVAIAIDALAHILYPQAFSVKVPEVINESVLKAWGVPTSIG